MNKPECYFCKRTHTRRKYHFYCKNGQSNYLVCASCIEQHGGKRKVQEELDRLPFAKKETNFSDRYTHNGSFFSKKNYNKNSWSPEGEFANFKSKSASAEGVF